MVGTISVLSRNPPQSSQRKKKSFLWPIGSQMSHLYDRSCRWDISGHLKPPSDHLVLVTDLADRIIWLILHYCNLENLLSVSLFLFFLCTSSIQQIFKNLNEMILHCHSLWINKKWNKPIHHKGNINNTLLLNVNLCSIWAIKKEGKSHLHLLYNLMYNI